MTRPRAWRLVLDATPWSVNAQVRWHYMQRAQVVREWRTAWALLARQQQVPALQACTVEVLTQVAKPGRLHDAGNEFYAAKAAIDGLVDAGVLPNDTPKHLHAITFHAPMRGDRTRMTLLIKEATR